MFRHVGLLIFRVFRHISIKTCLNMFWHVLTCLDMLTHFVSNRITFVFISDWHERGDMIFGIRHVWNCFKHICKWVSRLTRNYTILSVKLHRRYLLKINRISSYCSFGQVWTSLDKFGQVWTSLNKFEQVWTSLSNLNKFEET